jgi:hypothetical protein
VSATYEAGLNEQKVATRSKIDTTQSFVMYQALSGGVLDYQQQAQRRSLEQSKLKI